MRPADVTHTERVSPAPPPPALFQLLVYSSQHQYLAILNPTVRHILMRKNKNFAWLPGEGSVRRQRIAFFIIYYGPTFVCGPTFAPPAKM